MSLGIIIPLVVLPLLIVGILLWYRRSIAAMAPAGSKPVSGLRLTAEALHRMPSPPWRVVYEIGGALGEVDHVVVGPVGVLAITTSVADRPEPQQLLEARSEARLVSDAAIARGPMADLLRATAGSCDRSVAVFWGTPNARRPAADDVVHGYQLVEGQRIDQWLDALAAACAAPLDQARIDEIWSTIVTGIGRPDPLR